MARNSDNNRSILRYDNYRRRPHKVDNMGGRLNTSFIGDLKDFYIFYGYLYLLFVDYVSIYFLDKNHKRYSMDYVEGI